MSRFARTFVTALLVSALVCSTGAPAGAAGKKRGQKAPAPAPGKRVLVIDPIHSVRIEMPDHTPRDFGADFRAQLITHLTQSGRYVVAELPKPGPKPRGAGAFKPEVVWHDGGFVPAATVRISVDALSFRTGGRGTRMFYGFDERLRTPFNDGTHRLGNEFYHGEAFDGLYGQKGKTPFDSRSGLDLGEGFNLDALVAWLRVKYASYHSELRLRVEIDAPLAGRHELHPIQVKGSGFFFDVAGAYTTYQAGLAYARRDAMLKAFNRAFNATMAAIDRDLAQLPFTAVIDHAESDGTLYLGTGPDSQIPAGTRYEVIGNPQTLIEVTQAVSSGSLARVVAGDPAHALPGAVLRQAGFGLRPLETLHPADPAAARVAADNEEQLRSAKSGLTPTPTGPTPGAPVTVGPITIGAGENVNLPPDVISNPQLGNLVPMITRAQALWKSLVEGVFLPYRIWRYYQYDQGYHKRADDSSDSAAAGSHASDARNIHEWRARQAGSAWGRKIGLTASVAAHPRTLVAIIDSGIDYNHPVLHESLWLNPSPTTDPSGRQDRYGWDFISGDSRAYDDHLHGTQVASALLAIAPHARLMPLKITNPWGITNSAAIYAAIAYAVDHEAQLILLPWATRQDSQALEQGIAYAHSRGVPVVAAAGDLGRNLKIATAYPAAYAKKYDNLIVVGAVDAADKPLKISNYDPSLIHLAAPGHDIEVAEPRNTRSKASSTSLAAALAAGQLARLLPEDSRRAGIPAGEWRLRLQEHSERVPGLEKRFQNGYRLRLGE